MYPINIKSSTFLLLLSLLFCLSSCSPDERSLKREIRTAASDGLVSADECRQLKAIAAQVEETAGLSDQEWAAYLQAQKPEGKVSVTYECSDSSGIDSESVNKRSSCGVQPDSIHLYIENSGSMNAYLKPSGSFVQSLTDFMVQFDRAGQSFEYYFANNLTIPIDPLDGPDKNAESTFKRKSHLESWLTPAKMGRREMGDRANSKIMVILDRMAQQTLNDCQPRILVSDYVYSLVGKGKMKEEMAGTKSDLSVIFRPLAKKGLAVMMIKFEGDFDGKYYPFNSPSSGYQYEGKRPFYYWLIGNPAFLQQFARDYTLSAIPGYQEHVIICGNKNVEPAYSLLPYTAGPRGEKRQKPREAGAVVKHYENVSPSTRKGQEGLRLAVGLDLRHLIVRDKYLNNPANYRVVGDDGEDDWSVVEILPGSQMDKSDDGRISGGPSHIIVLESKRLKAEKRDLTLQFIDRRPEWLNNSYTDSDLQPEIDNIRGKTFGYNYLTDGVYDAFYGRQDEFFHFSIPFTLER